VLGSARRQRHFIGNRFDSRRQCVFGGRELLRKIQRRTKTESSRSRIPSLPLSLSLCLVCSRETKYRKVQRSRLEGNEENKGEKKPAGVERRMQKWHSSTRKQCRTCHEPLSNRAWGLIASPSHPPLPSFKHELPGIASRRVKITLSHATLCVPPCVSASRVKRTYARVAQVSTLDASRELSASIEITGPDPVGTIVDTVRVYRPRGLNGEEANQESALPYQCFPARAIASLARGSIAKPPRNQQIASREILQCGHGARCRL